MNKKICNGVIIIFAFLLMFLVTFPKQENTSIATGEDDLQITDRIPILTFHRIVPNDVKLEKYPDNQWVGSVDVFAEMMKYLYDNGYQTISNEEFYEWYTGKRQFTKKTVMITIDDGFYEDYYLVYPIIKKYGFKATSFVVGSRIREVTHPYDKNVTAYLGRDVIEKVRKEYPKYEFQSHSYDMHYYTKNKKHRIKSMSHNDLKNDVVRNREFGYTTMAYPFGDYNKMIEEILKEEGYLVAYRFTPSDYATRSSDQYAIPRIKINGRATLNTLKKWLNY